MDKHLFSFRQTVRHTDLDGMQDDLERALDTRTRELLGAGILAGGAVTPRDPPRQGQVRVAPTLAWDRKGRRIAVRRRFTDRVDAIIPLPALREEEIADIPKGDGCLVLVAKAARKSFALPFAFEGKTAMLGTSDDNARAHEIHAVVETTLGGLVPKQPALLLREDLPQQGYAPGCPPTGTPLTVDVSDKGPLTLDIGHCVAVPATSSGDARPTESRHRSEDETNDPVPKGKHRVVTLIARFARNLFDHRLDGHGESVPHRAVDHFAFVVDASAPPAEPGKAEPPALPREGVLLADVRLRHGEPVTQEDIDTSRQTRLHALQDLKPDHTAQLLHMALFGGGDVRWDGKTLRLPEDLGIVLPDSAAVHALPACAISIADNHAAWVLLPRRAEKKHTLAVVVLPVGEVPEHADNQLPWLLAARRGNILYGLHIGTFEPNQSKPLARGVPNETLKVLRQGLDKAARDEETLRTTQQQYLEQLQKLEKRVEQAQKTIQSLHHTQHAQGALVAWTRCELPGSPKLRALTGMYLAHYEGKIEVVAVGREIIYFDHNYRVWRVLNLRPTYPLNAVCYEFSQRRRLAVGDNGCAVTSSWPNPHVGNQWKHVNTGTNHTLRACAQAGKPWVVVGDNGTILTADKPDGPWTTRQSDTTKNLHAVANNGYNRWVVAGDDNTLLTSSDAVSWTRAAVPQRFFGGFARENCLPSVQLTWNKSQRRFFLFGEYNVLSSADGADWSLEQVVFGHGGPTVAGNGSQLLAFMNHKSYDRHALDFSHDFGKTRTSLFTTNIPYKPTYESGLFCLEQARCFYLLRRDPKTGNSELWQSGFV